MSDLRIEVVRGGMVESVHHVSAAVVGPTGRLVAASRDPELVTFWRSAAKPFQAVPLVADGAADRFGFGAEELALTCASHSSEPIHLAVVSRMLGAIGLEESALACGPHVPLSPGVAEQVLRDGVTLTPRWSNCSGKHAGMLAVAVHRQWPAAGYEQAGHPVQERIVAEIIRWTGVPARSLHVATDGCNTVCFALPLAAMALAYARLGISDDPAAKRLRAAMMAHPDLVAGRHRLCTELMLAWPGDVVAKVGAEGVYSAALPGLGLGVALKVHDGDARAAPVALLAVLRQVLTRLAPAAAPPHLFVTLGGYAEVPVQNTRGIVVGVIRPAGELHFFGSAARELHTPAHPMLR